VYKETEELIAIIGKSVSQLKRMLHEYIKKIIVSRLLN